jgi:alpha-mannosidase
MFLKRVAICCLVVFSSILCLSSNIEASESDWGVFAGGTVYVMPSSHQDTGWENTPDVMQCLRASCLMKQQVLPLLEDADKGFAYTVEEMLGLMELEDSIESGAEYITQEEFNKIIEYTTQQSPRLRWGALYNQPYESTLSGEQLVRVTYLGRKWLKDNYPGADSKVGHNLDVPSTAWQFPQILSKAGITGLVISRFDEGLYKWQSPDGSDVILYANGKYDGTLTDYAWRHTAGSWSLIDNYNHFTEATIVDPDTQKNVKPLVCHCFKNCEDCNTVIDVDFWLEASSYDSNLRTNDVEFWNEKYEGYGMTVNAPLPLYFITDANCALDFSTPIYDWSDYRKHHDYLPLIQHATTQDFIESVAETPNLNLPTVSGERPNIWLYIHGPGHYEALKYQRESAVYLPAAEAFATIDAVFEGTIDNYPDEFEDAWREALYPDVGWGGLNGETTDEVFTEKVQSARDTGLSLLQGSLGNIVKRVNPQNRPNASSIPIVVFNTLSWGRTGPVFVDVEQDVDSFYIVDLNGDVIDYQSAPPLDSSEVAEGMNRIVFVATDIPSMGYSTYYLVSGAPPTSANTTTNTPSKGSDIEYSDYTIQLGNGGLTRIYDRALEQEVIDSTYFPAGDVLSMFSSKYYYSDKTTHYHGTGAGEFSVMDQPVFSGDPDYDAVLEDFYKKTSDHNVTWQAASGPVRDVYTATYTLQPAVSPDYPGERYQPSGCSAECLQADVTQRISIYKSTKRILFELALEKWNQDGSGDTCNEACNYNKEFRMVFPLQVAEDDSRIFYEVPMGILELGVDDLQKDAVMGTPANAPGGWARQYNPVSGTYDTERYVQTGEEINLREIQNFMTAAGGDYAVTMSSSVAVADWKDIYHPTISNPNVMLQPLLFATRRSCHGDEKGVGYGNWYIQTGDHYYSFSLLSHAVEEGGAGWENGYRYGVSSNTPLVALVQTEAAETMNLLERYSFVEVNSDYDNVVITAFKKAEGSGNGDIILRVVEIEGKESEVTVSLPFTDIVSVYPTNLIEEIDISGTSVQHPSATTLTFNIKPYSIETFSIAHKDFPHTHGDQGGSGSSCSLNEYSGDSDFYLFILSIFLSVFTIFVLLRVVKIRMNFLISR